MDTKYELMEPYGSPFREEWGFSRDDDPFKKYYPERDNDVDHQNLHITFPNGVTLSIAWGWGAYATPSTVEIAAWDKEGNWITDKILMSSDLVFGDDVEGWCGAERVQEYFYACMNY